MTTGKPSPLKTASPKPKVLLPPMVNLPAPLPPGEGKSPKKSVPEETKPQEAPPAEKKEEAKKESGAGADAVPAPAAK